jgi:hypothetical protein
MMSSRESSSEAPYVAAYVPTGIRTLHAHSASSYVSLPGRDFFWRLRIRDLLTEFKEIFIDILPPLAANLEPFEIIVDRAKWVSDSNRSPIRSQSHLKVQHIKKHIDSKQQTTNNKQNMIVFCMLYIHKYPTVNCRKLFTVLLVNS